MSTTAEDYDHIPALEAADGSPPDVVPPGLELANVAGGPPELPPLPLFGQHPDFAATQAFFANLFQAVPPMGASAAAGTATNPTTAQNAPSNAANPPSAPAPPGNEFPPAGSAQGATPSGVPADSHPPPGFQALMNTLLAVGPPPGFSGGAHTAGAHTSPQMMLSALFGGAMGATEDEEDDDEEEEDGSGDNEETENEVAHHPEEDDEEVPPFEAAVPEAAPPQPSPVSQSQFATYMANLFASASATVPNATPGPATGSIDVAASIAGMPPWPMFPGAPTQGLIPAHPAQSEGTTPVAAATGIIATGAPGGVHINGFTLSVGPDGVGAWAPFVPPSTGGANENAAIPHPPGVMIDIGFVPVGGAVAGGTPFGPWTPPSVANGQPGPAPVILGPFNANNLPTLETLLASIPQGPWGHPPGPQLPPFDAVAFVDSLEQVDIATIPTEDMRCPHCWLDFGTTEDDVPDAMPATASDTTPETAERQDSFDHMPFTAPAPNNDPVRTPCGHNFGRDCLIESLQKVSTLCPTCRQELRPAPETPAMPAVSPISGPLFVPQVPEVSVGSENPEASEVEDVHWLD